MAVIKSGAGVTTQTFDPTSNAARTTDYDTAGNVLAKVDKTSLAVTPGTTSGLPIVGVDGKTPRLLRSSTDGSLADGRPMLAMLDLTEGAAVNTQTWLQTTTTMTIAQAAGIITLNNGSSFATTVGAMLTTLKQFIIMPRSKMVFRSRQRHTAHFTNNVIEIGFNTALVATTAMTTGAYSGAIWRKDGTGQYVPVIVVGGSETLGTPISNATWISSIAASDYGIFEVEVEAAGAIFRAYTLAGALVNEQRIDFPSSVGDWTVTHLPAGTRTYNSGSTGTAVQVLIADSEVYMLDVDVNKPWPHIMAGCGFHSAQSPTAYTQAAQFTNNGASATVTPTNTTIGTASLGGHISWNNAGTSFGASDTADWLLFSFQVPSPYAFYLTGVKISTANLGAANGATSYTLEYALVVGNSAVSLATATNPRFIALGFQTLAAAAAIGATFDKDTSWTPGTPICIMPNRYVQIAARVISGTATASQVIRTVAAIDGYFQ